MVYLAELSVCVTVRFKFSYRSRKNGELSVSLPEESTVATKKSKTIITRLQAICDIKTSANTTNKVAFIKTKLSNYILRAISINITVIFLYRHNFITSVVLAAVYITTDNPEHLTA